MRRAFTLIELMVASSISGLILTALCVALTSVWREAIKTNEEMQLMLKASAMRERLLLGTAKEGAKGFHGLLNVTGKVEPGSDGKFKTLTVYAADGTVDRDESLPGTGNGLTFGSSKANSTKSVSVTNVAENVMNSFGYKETQQRVKIYLWVSTKAGSACRMPVNVTVLKDEGE